MQKLLHSCK